jgi:hypothetical protein
LEMVSPEPKISLMLNQQNVSIGKVSWNCCVRSTAYASP